ncbi:MAG TPA: tRNA 2-thiouridine(34) synthase MnmA [Acidimicrobiales bacterium]|nr:tRNA 2-thiouridine(34) synthase MnmA [Acidimicrobiales bacterium]
MKVLVALSGGVDSSVAAALLLDAGHDVVGVTMKLWGGESDTGCCSVSDVDDARRVARSLGIEHHVFNFGDRFATDVIGPYVSAHAGGDTPNPCIECNRHLKFDKLLRRARALGFDAIATGHHARVVTRDDGSRRIARGADVHKDQSYVLYMLDQTQLAATLLPVGELTKAAVRAHAAELALPTAAKPDSQDVCFITSSRGRRGFLEGRLGFTPGNVVDRAGNRLGSVDAVELVTIGQRKGLGLRGGDDAPRYVVSVDVGGATVTVGAEADLLEPGTALRNMMWADGKAARAVLAQCSAHGPALAASFDPSTATLTWESPHRRVAPGQAVVLYDGDEVVGGGLAVSRARARALR